MALARDLSELRANVAERFDVTELLWVAVIGGVAAVVAVVR